MIKFVSLSSGSKGNCSLVETSNLRLLIDIGVTYMYLSKNLESLDLTPYDIDGILITHIHSDHVKGLKQLVNKTKIKVYIPSKMKDEVTTIIDDDCIEIIDDITDMIDTKIELIYTSHDTECSVGYIITNEEESLVYITDTGYINRKYMKMLNNKTIYFIESNHDEEMLMDGPYPYYLKQRVISDSGHLSNKMTAKYLSTMVGDKTKYVILAHISKNNNTEELALETTINRLKKTNYQGEVLLAKEFELMDVIEV